MGCDEYFELISDIRLDLTEVLGRGYVIDYCIASLRRKNKELAYRVYITDALKAVAENTSRYAGGTVLSKRFAEYLEPPKKEMTAQEVIDKIKKKMRGGAS